MNFNSFSHLLSTASWQAALKWWILSELTEYIRGKTSIWYNAMHRLMYTRSTPQRRPDFAFYKYYKEDHKVPFLSSWPESIAECFPPFWHRTPWTFYDHSSIFLKVLIRIFAESHTFPQQNSSKYRPEVTGSLTWSQLMIVYAFRVTRLHSDILAILPKIFQK